MMFSVEIKSDVTWSNKRHLLMENRKVKGIWSAHPHNPGTKHLLLQGVNRLLSAHTAHVRGLYAFLTTSVIQVIR